MSNSARAAAAAGVDAGSGSARAAAAAGSELNRAVSAGCKSALDGFKTATVLRAVASLCATQEGAARIIAAGLLPHVVP
jgi:hypothetical protein